MLVDPAVVAAILAFAGIGVVGITEMVKRLFGVEGLWAYIISAVVSAAATAFTLYQAASFGWLPFVLYTLFVFLEANGIYKAINK
jgi:hypothetical protein